MYIHRLYWIYSLAPGEQPEAGLQPSPTFTSSLDQHDDDHPDDARLHPLNSSTKSCGDTIGDDPPRLGAITDGRGNPRLHISLTFCFCFFSSFSVRSKDTLIMPAWLINEQGIFGGYGEGTVWSDFQRTFSLWIQTVINGLETGWTAQSNYGKRDHANTPVEWGLWEELDEKEGKKRTMEVTNFLPILL